MVCEEMIPILESEFSIKTCLGKNILNCIFHINNLYERLGPERNSRDHCIPFYLLPNELGHTESNIFQVIFHLTLIVHFVYFLVFFCFLKANARPRGQCKVGLRPQILSRLSRSSPNSRITKSWVFCI